MTLAVIEASGVSFPIAQSGLSPPEANMVYPGAYPQGFCAVERDQWQSADPPNRGSVRRCARGLVQPAPSRGRVGPLRSAN